MHIKNRKLSQGQLNILANALGKSISDKVFEETLCFRGVYKDLENMFIYLFETETISFDSFSLYYSICMLIEHQEGIRNTTYIGPFSFAEGIARWNFSGSKASLFGFLFQSLWECDNHEEFFEGKRSRPKLLWHGTEHRDLCR